MDSAELGEHQEVLNLFFMETLQVITQSPLPPHHLSNKWINLIQKLLTFAQTDDQLDWAQTLYKLKQDAMVKTNNPNYRNSLKLLNVKMNQKFCVNITNKSYINFHKYVKYLKFFFKYLVWFKYHDHLN
jgi:hypothetical protein